MRTLYASLGLVFLSLSSSFAATAVPAKPAPAVASAPTTTPKTAQTTALAMGARPAASTGNIKLSFELSPMGSFDAKSTAVSGEVINQSGKFVPPAKVTVDMRMLTTGIKLRDQHLQKSLGTQQFPTASLTAITVTSADAGKGTLSFHGQAHPVQFTFAPNSSRDKMKASFKLKISDWGVTEGLSYMGVNVEDEVVAEIEIAIKK